MKKKIFSVLFVLFVLVLPRILDLIFKVPREEMIAYIKVIPFAIMWTAAYFIVGIVAGLGSVLLEQNGKTVFHINIVRIIISLVLIALAYLEYTGKGVSKLIFPYYNNGAFTLWLLFSGYLFATGLIAKKQPAE